MIGPLVNACATVLGGVIGACAGSAISDKYKANLPLTFGIASMGMGVVMVAQMKTLPAVVIALLLGSVLGEMANLERTISSGALRAKGLLEKITPRKGTAELSQEEFLDKFVAILVLFVASGTGVFGAMNEGITGDPTILLAKSVLDLCTATIFATTLGLSVCLIAVPQVLVQLTLFALGQSVMAITTPAMNADFSALGGMIMLATGFRIAGIKSFPIANLLPGLLLVMPLSYLWTTYLVPLLQGL